jgi:hypothetical protein
MTVRHTFPSMLCFCIRPGTKLTLDAKLDFWIPNTFKEVQHNTYGISPSLYINSATLCLTPLDIFQQTMELNRIVQSRIIASFLFCEFGPSSSDGSYHLTLFRLLNKLPIQIDAASADTEYIGSYAWQLTLEQRLLQYTGTFNAN